MTTSDRDLLDWSPEAVVFDCDGTLMDSERHWQEARSRAFREHGLQPPPGFAEQALGLHYEDCGRLMAQAVHKPDLAEDLTAALLDHFLALVTGEPVTMPGAVRLVRLLSGRLPLAVASNCPRVVVEGSLERAGLLAHFQCLVVPDTGDCVRPKPYPDVYAVAARLCGVPPHRAMAVEDSLAGVEAARRASLRVLGVGPRPQGDGATRADAWLPSLDAPELLAWAHALGSPRGPRQL
ncbi:MULTISPECIES: HAD family hydrolase [Streptomyces]|uniref:Hydrolase n=1 Tax=Streptomyces coelicolor (strain ATCC BAA-471 / A3(2) / M145) TaxID=100226 RepID=Q93RS1_STRCO|nr:MULTISPECIES: HAD family phosphatase [Streptomyces]MYU45837.1 HAD-IA family hydrolase [Streptomyces sp. SID7813]MDX2928591.1 HAD family phosphatase [Streptomyces sp. NRRL_B-16638]MDX3366589.1 HAD family phosphatase [Streptomyces sp. ME02-6987-2C]MDX3404699.1 HAD family phosphatase [Streptomyces sp. ME02-6977A]MDX3425559.1 HAD family phosphatase [Streptomyces sp. ME02-6985-2c]